MMLNFHFEFYHLFRLDRKTPLLFKPNLCLSFFIVKLYYHFYVNTSY